MSEFKYIYNTPVKVSSGFFRGAKGRVKDINIISGIFSSDYTYLVKGKNFKEWIFESHLAGGK